MTKFVKITSHEIRAAGYGREQELMAEIIGCDKLIKRGQPCPACGGDNRFTYKSKDGSFFCRGYGKGGDWLEMLVHIEGDYGRGADRAKAMLGLDENSYDIEKLRAEQLERAEKRAKEKEKVLFRKQANESMLDHLFDLQNEIIKRGDEQDFDEYETYLARELYIAIKVMYSK